MRATAERDEAAGTAADSPGGSGVQSSVANVLVLSVVHPDYLPSLYALSTVLDRHDYAAHVFSFESAAAPSASWNELRLHSCGAQRGGALARWRARRRLVMAADRWSHDNAPVALIATCPFTLVAAIRMAKRRLPVLYFSYETHEVRAREALRSPLSWLRSRAAFRHVRDADLVCVPSAERAGWLLGRARLERAPDVVLNCPARQMSDSLDDGRGSPVAVGARHHTVVVHTGRVSHAQATLELVDSVEHWPAGVMLVVTNVGSSGYENAVREAAGRSLRADDIVLLPAIGRSEMLALQRSATIGIFLTRETSALETLMPAPNKVAEYIHAGLLTVGSPSPYLEGLKRHGVAILVESLSPGAIADAVGQALDHARQTDARSRVLSVARDWYNMDVQALPVIRLLNAVRERGQRG